VKLVVSLDNLARQLTGDDGDADRVAWFTDRVIGAAGPAALTPDGLYWYLEPNDYPERPDYRAAIIPRLDRVLAHADPDAALIRWITPRALSELGLRAEAASQRAWSNLSSSRSATPFAPSAATGPTPAAPKSANSRAMTQAAGARRGHRHIPAMPGATDDAFLASHNHQGRLAPARRIGWRVRHTTTRMLC
jgi:hypothetical protein